MYYWIPVRLKRLGFIQSDKGKGSVGTILCLIRECPLVSPFWDQVIKTMKE